MEWMLLPLKRYADFEGRSRRKEYWMFVLFNLIVYAVLAVLAFGSTDFTAAAQGASSSPSPLLMIAFGLFAIFALAMFIPGLAVQVRRFHDQDKSGWFVLLGLIPYIGGLIVLVFMCIDGTRGSNAYGQDPKDPYGEEAAPYGEPQQRADPLPRRPDLM